MKGGILFFETDFIFGDLDFQSKISPFFKDGIRESEHCKKGNLLMFDCFEDGDNWYDGLWRMGIVDGERVVKSYVQKCNDEIEIYQSKIKEIENNIKEFNN